MGCVVSQIGNEKISSNDSGEDSNEPEEIVFGSEKSVNQIQDSLKNPTFLVTKKSTSDALDMLELENTYMQSSTPHNQTLITKSCLKRCSSLLKIDQNDRKVHFNNKVIHLNKRSRFLKNKKKTQKINLDDLF